MQFICLSYNMQSLFDLVLSQSKESLTVNFELENEKYTMENIQMFQLTLQELSLNQLP